MSTREQTLLRDAKRYRWLISHATHVQIPIGVLPDGWGRRWFKREITPGINKAMAAQHAARKGRKPAPKRSKHQ